MSGPQLDIRAFKGALPLFLGRRNYVCVKRFVKKPFHLVRQVFEAREVCGTFWKALRSLDASPYKPEVPFESEFPTEAAVEINNTCNINCLMCDTWSAKRQKGVIEIDLLEKVLTELKAQGVRSVGVHTIGDPLANPRLPQILAVFREKGIHPGLSTNGLLVERHLDTLIKYSDVTTDIRFSIDGATKNTYERIRAGGSWKTLLRNLELAKKELVPIGYHISSNMVVSKDNVQEVGLFVEVFREFFDPIDMSFSLVNSLAPDTSYFNRVNLFPNHTLPNRPCRLPFQSFWVHIDGRVSSCCRDYHGEVIVGDIKEDSIRQIWNGGALERLREAHKRGDVNGYRLCMNCYIPDPRIGCLFSAMMGCLVRRFPRARAEFFQERVDRLEGILQGDRPFEPQFRRLDFFQMKGLQSAGLARSANLQNADQFVVAGTRGSVGRRSRLVREKTANPRVVAIIQARMGSRRLPGKVMLDLGGEPMLAHVIRRVRRATTPHDVVVATSTLPEDDPVAELATARGVGLFRGSLDDVLDRYVRAAEAARADVVVRITGDCPFIEPEFIDMAVRHHLASGADYTCAQVATEFPLGTGNEVVSLSALRQAWQRGTTPPDREHVTWYILSNRDEFKIEFLRGDDRLTAAGVQLVVDTWPDLALAREIVARLAPDNPDFGLREILALRRRDPALFDLNAGVERNPTLCVP